MKASAYQTTNENNDHINLSRLIIKLYEQKTVILVSVLITMTLMFWPTIGEKPIYKVLTEIQPPTSSQVNFLNASEIISYTPEEAFKDFLAILESSSHKKQLIKQNKQLIAQLFEIKDNQASIENIDIDYLFDITYPKNTESLAPKIYTVITKSTQPSINGC